MTHPRFYVPQLPLQGSVQLDGLEGRHASNVLRLQVGAPVVLFDGQGGEALGFIEALGQGLVEVHIEHRSDTQRELPSRVELFVALPKGDRQRTLVDGLVQLGVSKLTPLQTMRGVAQPSANALKRLERGVIESSKQCGRNLFMQIGQPVTIRELASDGPGSIASFVAHPYGAAETLQSLPEYESQARFAIGPEGGFAEDELQLLRQAQWKPISLGVRILRIEVAALCIASCWACRHQT